MYDAAMVNQGGEEYIIFRSIGPSIIAFKYNIFGSIKDILFFLDGKLKLFIPGDKEYRCGVINKIYRSILGSESVTQNRQKHIFKSILNCCPNIDNILNAVICSLNIIIDRLYDPDNIDIANIEIYNSKVIFIATKYKLSEWVSKYIFVINENTNLPVQVGLPSREDLFNISDMLNISECKSIEPENVKKYMIDNHIGFSIKSYNIVCSDTICTKELHVDNIDIMVKYLNAEKLNEVTPVDINEVENSFKQFNDLRKRIGKNIGKESIGILKGLSDTKVLNIRF